MKTKVQQIKISSTGKGLHHWEQYLKIKTKRRLTKLLFELDCSASKKSVVLKIYQDKVTNDNIIPISNHNIQNILLHLIKNQLDILIKNTKIEKL